MHDAPPDILLTNYKMLDHLLLHPGRADMWRLSAESLQYLVLDEFHTYDGAQGTDVAMLLRRLGLTLKSHWTATSRVTDEDRARPLGRVTPVATSATLGRRRRRPAMLRLRAHRVRRAVRRRRGDRRDAAHAPTSGAAPGSAARDHEWQPDRTGPARRARSDHRRSIGPQATTRPSPRRSSPNSSRRPREPSGLARACPGRRGDAGSAQAASVHPGRVGARCRRGVAADLAERVFPAVLVDRDAARTRATRVRFLEFVVRDALARPRARPAARALGVDVHLWIRELSRVDRAVRAATEYRWSDDGALADDNELYLPAVYCRHCGRSGLGCAARADRQRPRRHRRGDPRRPRRWRVPVPRADLRTRRGAGAPAASTACAGSTWTTAN